MIVAIIRALAKRLITGFLLLFQFDICSKTVSDILATYLGILPIRYIYVINVFRKQMPVKSSL